MLFEEPLKRALGFVLQGPQLARTHLIETNLEQERLLGPFLWQVEGFACSLFITEIFENWLEFFLERDSSCQEVPLLFCCTIMGARPAIHPQVFG